MPIHLLCLVHPGAAAAAAATMVLTTLWVRSQELPPQRPFNHQKPCQSHQQEPQNQSQRFTKPHGTTSKGTMRQHDPPSPSPHQQQPVVVDPSKGVPQDASCRARVIQQSQGIIYQAPPADYATRIPVTFVWSQVPAAVHAAARTTALQQRSQPPAPALLPRPAAGLTCRQAAAPPAHHPNTAMGSAGSSMRRLPLGLLAAAAVVLAGVAAMPQTLHGIIDRWYPKPDKTDQQQQQQQQRLPFASAPLASGVSGPLAGSTGSTGSTPTPGQQSTSQHSTARQAATAGAAGLPMSYRQASTWTQQQMPAVLARKREELLHMQGLQADLKGLQETLDRFLGGRTAGGRTAVRTAGRGTAADSSTGGAAAGGSRPVGREVLLVFGSLQGCLSEELESLQVQVEALDSQLHQ